MQPSIAWRAAERCSERGQPHCRRIAAATEPSPSDRPEMGYAGPMRFEPAELALLAETEEVEIETARPGGPPIGRSSGSSSTATTSSSARSTARGALVPRGRRQPVGHHPRRRARHPRPGRRGGRPRLGPAHERRARAQVRRRRGATPDARSPTSSTPPSAHARLSRCPARRADWSPRPMYFDEFKHQLPDIDPAETDDWLTSLDQVVAAGGRDPRPVPPLQAAQARAPAPDRAAAADPDPLHQHDQPGAGAGLPGRRGDGAADPPDDPLERGRDGPAREQPVLGDRRPPRDVRLGGDALRGRLQPLLPRQGRRRQRRPDLLPGPRRAGHLRPRVPRGPAERRPARPLPARDDAGRGPQLVPAPAPDARLLGVPDGLDGPRPDQRDLPGALQPLPPQPRPARHLGLARLGVPRRRRDRRARVARRAPRRGARGPRQPDLRRQLQPAAPRRPGPRQRQDHPGARVRLPRRRLERHQGHLGPRVGRAPRARRRRRARPADERDARRRVPEVLGRRRRLHPRALLRARPAARASSSSTCPTTTSPSSAAAATTTARSTPPTRPRPSTRARRR